MRGAPQPGFSLLMRRMRSRTSRGTRGRPGLPLRIFQVQKRRNALRCQAITVRGFTITSAERQSAHRGTAKPTGVGQVRAAAGACSQTVEGRRADVGAQCSPVAERPASSRQMRLPPTGSSATWTSKQLVYGSGATPMISVTSEFASGHSRHSIAPCDRSLRLCADSCCSALQSLRVNL